MLFLVFSIKEEYSKIVEVHTYNHSAVGNNAFPPLPDAAAFVYVFYYYYACGRLNPRRLLLFFSFVTNYPPLLDRSRKARRDKPRKYRSRDPVT